MQCRRRAVPSGHRSDGPLFCHVGAVDTGSAGACRGQIWPTDRRATESRVKIACSIGAIACSEENTAI